MNIFDFDAYPAILEEMIRFNAHVRGYKSQLAKAAQCQNSYFSLVLGHKADLNPDQASALTDFWELNSSEADYFINLVLLARASTDSFKQRILGRLKDLQEQFSVYRLPKAVTNIQDVKLSAEDQTFFLQHWLCPSVLTLLRFEKTDSAAKVAQYLQMPINLIQLIIDRLEKMGLLVRENGRFLPQEHLVLVENHSDLSLLHSALQERAKSQNALTTGNNLRYTFSGTLSKERFDAVKAAFQEAVRAQLLELHDDKGGEILIGFSYDIFEI
ncbi:MAG: DUF4423 domain-containing protein [Proteobacteria bacterium]|nr:MAG: DUF4423 domain-containing protein [Pseudomonadota bacterium]